MNILAATLLYWVLVATGWYFYTTRPPVRARARQHDFKEAAFDPRTGKLLLVYESSISLVRIGLALLAPPVLLIILWLATRGR